MKLNDEQVIPIWGRNQMMAKYQANHVPVAYADSPEAADHPLFARTAMARRLGLKVNVCGTRKSLDSW